MAPFSGRRVVGALIWARDGSRRPRRRRNAPRGAHLESFELSPPERLIGRRRPEDQRGNPGAQASDNGSNHGLRWDTSHVSRVRLAGVDVPLPRTLLIVWPISCIPHRVGAVVPPGLVTNFNESPIDERPTPLCPLRTLGRPFDDDSKEGRDCETPGGSTWPASRVTQNTSSGRNLPQDRRRGQRSRRVWSFGWRARGLG